MPITFIFGHSIDWQSGAADWISRSSRSENRAVLFDSNFNGWHLLSLSNDLNTLSTENRSYQQFWKEAGLIRN